MAGGNEHWKAAIHKEVWPGMMSLLPFRLFHTHARPIATNKRKSERAQYLLIS
jgi:hypothetical protein